jgi:fructokinase
MRIGIDLGGTKTEFIALDNDGSELYRRRIPTPAGDYDAIVRTVTDGIAAIESESGQTGSIGIGIPGAISPRTGLVKNANSTCLIGHPFDRDLEAAIGRPVRIANDANCFTLSEAVDGAGRDAPTVFGVILGTGVGGGIAIDGAPVRGANAIAGEWGHNPLPWPEDDERPGPTCYCGQTGCIETFLSGPGLVREHEALCGETREPDDIARRAAAGDQTASVTLALYERRLARALATVINIFDPDVIVLGGGLSNIERLYETVPALWPRWVFSDGVDTRLRPPVHGDSSGVRGAAWLWPGTNSSV